MKLSIRLQKICDLVNSGTKTLADVGCDHGKVVAELFLENKIDFAYLSDISEPSVRKAERLLKELNISEDKYKVLVTDGLTNFNVSHIDTVIIAGMGGLEIEKIIKNSNTDISEFILAPNNNDVSLRKYLLQNNYKIVTDFVVKDANKYYNIMKVISGKQKLNKMNIFFGFTNFENITEDFKDYLNYEKSKISNILINMPYLKSIKYRKRLRLIGKAINKISRRI